MGNQQGIAGSFLTSTCVPGRRKSMRHAYKHKRLLSESEGGTTEGEEDVDLTDSSSSSSSSEDEEKISELLNNAAELENIIINNDGEHLKQVCAEQKIDLNIELNEKGETALILSVKLSHLDMVKILLSNINCEKNASNSHNFSALDVALVTAFDNRLEPRQTISWQIIECLLQVNAEPVNKDAMMYVVRTALKYCDEAFLYRLILLAVEWSNSFLLHELLLQKLHRHQPIYIESIDPILLCMSDFTIKLLKNANGRRLGHIVNSMAYYLESYWSSRESKISTFRKLILYATGAGWVWTRQQMVHINRVCPHLASWCKGRRYCALSLTHIARVSFRQNVQCLVKDSIPKLPYPVPDSIKEFLVLKDIDELVAIDDLNISDIQL